MAPGMVQGKNEYPAEDFDPSDPNCLSPKLHVTDYVNDPTFESKETIPFISTMALSKLLIRAVLLGDNDLLQEIIQDKSNIYSFCVPRSVDVDRDALSYALQTENVAAVKILMDSKRAEKPACGIRPAASCLRQVSPTVRQLGTRRSDLR